MNDCELNFKMSDEEMEKIKEILTKNKGIKHYLLKLSNSQKLDVVEYKEYEILRQRIDKAIEYIKKAYQEDEDNKIPLEDLYLKNCTYNPSLVALSILQGEEVK